MIIGRSTHRFLFEAVSFFLVFAVVATSTFIPVHAAAFPSDQRLSDPQSAQQNPQTPNCNLYPIALHESDIAGVAPGGLLDDIFPGTQSGNFGWLTWAGSPSAPTLAQSLTPPGDSDTYVNPSDPSDHIVSVGDWVQGSPGVANSKAVRDALDILKTITITVPVWDESEGQGNNTLYHVVDFADVQITDFRLPRQNRISAILLGTADCDTGSGNNPPVAEDDAYDVDEDEALTVAAPGVLDNDDDVDGDPLSAVLVDGPADGSLVL